MVLREPHVEDGAEIWELVDRCKPLDLNSAYAYLLVCRDFAETSVVAEVDGDLVGFISAYRPPRRPDVIFVWQVAVHDSQRGKGLAKRMLQAILKREECSQVHFLETTVTPSNKPSRALFSSFARDLGTRMEDAVGFPSASFPRAQHHEEERLLRIGPFEPGGSDL